MEQVRQILRNRWFIPAISATLILTALLLRHAGGRVGAVVLGPRWWLPSAADVRAPEAFTLPDLVMVAAAAVAGLPVLVRALRALRAHVIGIDLLVAIAALGALAIGSFWEAAAVTFLFALGHALEDATLGRTRSALTQLVALAPQTATVIRQGSPHQVPASQVHHGETVLVRNGARIPVDGRVISGTGAIDESSITGESIPVEKSVGGRVFAGTICRGGVLEVRATGIGSDTTLARIIHRVEDAQDAQAPTQTFMERFSRWYTPAVIVLASAVGLATGDIARALTLLVISCPGALVISIPVAVVAGIGRAARTGILIKGGEYLETTARISAVALDKTGTLTQGHPHLEDVVVLDPARDEGEVLGLAAAAEIGSEHPLAPAVLEAARARGAGPGGLPDQVTPVPGAGIIARVGGRRVLVASLSLLPRQGVEDPGGRAARAWEDLAARGRTPMVVAVDQQVIGVLGVADRVRTEAPQMVEELRRTGVTRIVMLTGDARPVAEAVAAATGITEVRAGLLPEDKQDAVAALRHDGHVIAMVGDGVNDTTALATADIGVAMGAAGSAVAVETADIALMSQDLLRVPQALGIAKRTVRVMRQNIVVALATVALLLVGVFTGGVTMALGMLVHEASVLVVILNAMRLMGARGVRGSRSAHRSGPREDIEPRAESRRLGVPRMESDAHGGVGDASHELHNVRPKMAGHRE